MKQIHLLVIATLALFAACSDGTGPTDSTAGSLSFSYTSGVTSGSYSATGTMPTNEDLSHTSTWSTAFLSNIDNSIVISSNRATGGGLANGAILFTDRQTVGTSTISDTCEPSATTSCAFIAFVIGANETGTTFSHSCIMAEGTITISQVSATHISGSFSGEGVCFSSAAIADGTITGGTFSVPLQPDESGGL